MEYIKKGIAAYTLDAIYHSEGRVKYTGTTPRYEYTLTDHLGNGRVYYTDLNADGAITTADILQDNHYYPFGLNHTDPRRNTGGLGVNKYQYNGKELVDDDGLGWNHYGARCYDAAVGRWWVVDKLLDEPEQIDKSPFAYGWDNPVKEIDPDGNCPSCFFGALAGAAVEYTGQVIANAYEGKRGSEMFTDIDVLDVAVAAGEGFVTNGASAVRGVVAKGAVKLTAEIVRNAADVKVQNGKTTTKIHDTKSVVKNTTIGLVSGAAGSVAPKVKGKLVTETTPSQAVGSARKAGAVNRAQRLEVEKTAKANLKEAKAINETAKQLPVSIVSGGTSEITKRKTDTQNGN
jgi:RHS repeat-associated protein